MICVVEDDPNIREIEVYAMKDCHMETKEASCAKEFWKLCENCLLYTSDAADEL